MRNAIIPVVLLCSLLNTLPAYSAGTEHGRLIARVVELDGLDKAFDAIPVQRIVATGGGTRIEPWIQALADCTQVPVHVCAVPEGGALGAAFLARVAAGLEPNMNGAARWARISHIVEPDPAWAAAVGDRYARFVDVAG